MFAEELAGNASRKRAEQNRARRRQLKAQREKNAAAATPTATAATTTINALPSSSGTPSPDTAAATASASVLAPPTSIAPSKTSSAVEKAQQQRQIRAEAAVRERSATCIQARYRRHRSNVTLHENHSQLLTKKLQDIGTLRSLLLQTKQIQYAPPPATTTALLQQLLFISTINGVKRPAGGMLENVLLCILPVVASDDENTNPVLVWLQSAAGRRRWIGLLRLTIVMATQGHVSKSALEVSTQFLSLILGEEVPMSINKFCRSKLLTTSRDFTYTAGSPPPFADDGSPMYLIAILRYYFLLVSAGNVPIPPNAMEDREQSILPASRIQGGQLFMVLLKAISGDKALESQIISRLMTIPLMTWKISDSVVNHVIGHATGSTDRCCFMTLIRSFCNVHSSQLVRGEIDMVLSQEDLPLTKCPATSTQCLLANLMQLGRRCAAINCSDTARLDYGASADFFGLIGVLLDDIPLGTFTSRESAVEWVDQGNGHHKPVVLSPVIIEQCKSLLVDSFVRRLFTHAIDTDALKIDSILEQKDEKDRKLEKDLSDKGVSSAAALAAREAQVDRNKSFWKASKWAKKLTHGVASLLSGDGSKQPPLTGSGKGQLLDTSTVSRDLAGGSKKKSEATEETTPPSAGMTPKKYDVDFLFALSKVFAVILARWGGGGSSDIVQRKPRDRSKGERETATAAAEPFSLSILNTLCFGTPLVKVLWGIIQSDDSVVRDVYSAIDVNRGKVPVRLLRVKPAFNSKERHDGAALLYLFVSVLSHTLILTDDIEIHEMSQPLPVHQLRRCIQVLKKLLFRACCTDDRSATLDSNYFGLALIAGASRTMRDLYDRSSRRPLCAPKLWNIADLMERDIRQCKTHEDFVALLSQPVLRVCPFLVSFKRRLQIFERIVTTNRIQVQGVNDANPFNPNPLKRGIPVRITRGRILEDGLATMNNLGKDMRQRISVTYYNAAGQRESGIDAGGLFKEFWTDLCAIAFNPNYALFRVTDDSGCMYPNPSSGAAHGPDHIVLFEFLGRILGKALFEGITIHPLFSHFFLSFLRGDYNYLHMLPDLSSVDSQLYNNLMFLKTYDGDASDLCLTFSITNDDFGGAREVPLIPNGENIEVTNANKQRYIGLVAKYYVVDRVQEQSQAFTRGLWEVIDRSWLRIFNEPELQVLISGATDGKLDVEDLRAHTRYTGGFSGLDRTVNRFWKVLAAFNSKQQADLLRFVTSCERPPPLGFSSLNPPFTIQRVGIMRDGDKLPTASTCFNILKLPTYSSEKVLRERLLYSIEAGAGFELS